MPGLRAAVALIGLYQPNAEEAEIARQTTGDPTASRRLQGGRRHAQVWPPSTVDSRPENALSLDVRQPPEEGRRVQDMELL